MKCFYHKSDLDGQCSGAIVKHRYPECEMFGVDYDDTLPKITEDLGLKYNPGEDIYVVDFSFAVEEMLYLQTVTKGRLIWIDHHKSAIEKTEAFWFDGIQNILFSACELTWRFIYDHSYSIGYVPDVVSLLGRYDVWGHDSQPFILEFQYGMRSLGNLRPDREEAMLIWSSLFESNEDVQYIITDGSAILRYQKSEDEKYAKSMFYECEFEGHRVIVINKALANSKIFDSVYDPGKHDIMVLFSVTSKSLKYSLYCDKPGIDVSKIANKYGGGGHKGAAGFYSEERIL